MQLALKPYKYLFKFVVIGDAGVGKSCILSQVTNQKFSSNYITTAGVEYNSINIEMDGSLIKLQIWDTSGEESYKLVTQSYLRGAVGAILVYDITKKESYENAKSVWLKELHQNCSSSNIVIALCGNKCDLNDSRQVNTKDASEFAAEKNIIFLETSAKTGHNMGNILTYVVRKIFETMPAGLEAKGDEHLVPHVAPHMASTLSYEYNSDMESNLNRVSPENEGISVTKSFGCCG